MVLGRMMRRQRTRPKYEDVAACVVKEQRSGEIVYHEMFESGGMSPERAATRLLYRADALRRRFPEPKFEVEHTVFGNVAAFRALYPSLGPKKALS